MHNTVIRLHLASYIILCKYFATCLTYITTVQYAPFGYSTPAWWNSLTMISWCTFKYSISHTSHVVANSFTLVKRRSTSFTSSPLCYCWDTLLAYHSWNSPHTNSLTDLLMLISSGWILLVQFARTKDTRIVFSSSTPSTVAVHCALNLSKITKYAWSSGHPNSFLFCLT